MAYMRMRAVEKAVEKATGKSPCMGCTDRVLGCSADCEKYKDWRQKVYETRQKILDQDRDERAFAAYKNVSYTSAVKKGLVTEKKQVGFRKKYDNHRT